MPSKSRAQSKLMTGACKSAKFRKKTGIPKHVACDFHVADKGKYHESEGPVTRLLRLIEDEFARLEVDEVRPPKAPSPGRLAMRRVQEVYPQARSEARGLSHVTILAAERDAAGTLHQKMLGSGSNPEAAWLDAAQRLDQPDED